ncbi:MAG: hypothetical protein HKN17_01385 [Rhodothermales bacterium]|nr:hypothetical protein [Rhodothermales bacterium]
MVRLAAFILLPVIVVSIAASLSGCLGTSREVVDPEARFGHRVEDGEDASRQTIAITPPDTTRTYRFFAATYDEVNIRPAPLEPESASTGTAVELLIKGAFPDACSELHDVQQQRSGNLIDITLTMRRQRGAVCASVLRPYRFYLTLEGRYAPGSYRIELNDGVHTFQVRARDGR